MKPVFNAALLALLYTPAQWAAYGADSTPYVMPAPVIATATAPDSVAGMTLTFTYPEGTGKRSREAGGIWSEWESAAAPGSHSFDYTFDKRNRCVFPYGNNGSHTDTLTYEKISEGEAFVTMQTTSKEAYSRKTKFRLIFTAPDSGAASCCITEHDRRGICNNTTEIQMTHFRFNLNGARAHLEGYAEWYRNKGLKSCAAQLDAIRLGGDINGTHGDGSCNSALINAAYAGNDDLLQELLDLGADIHATNKEGWDAIITAAYKGEAMCVERLLQAGADADSRTPSKSTLLMVAAMFGHTEVIRVLDNAGADLDATTPNGKTALQLAEEKGRTAAAKLLRNLAATPEDQASENWQAPARIKGKTFSFSAPAWVKWVGEESTEEQECPYNDGPVDWKGDNKYTEDGFDELQECKSVTSWTYTKTGRRTAVIEYRYRNEGGNSWTHTRYVLSFDTPTSGTCEIELSANSWKINGATKYTAKGTFTLK